MVLPVLLKCLVAFWGGIGWGELEIGNGRRRKGGGRGGKGVGGGRGEGSIDSFGITFLL